MTRNRHESDDEMADLAQYFPESIDTSLLSLSSQNSSPNFTKIISEDEYSCLGK